MGQCVLRVYIVKSLVEFNKLKEVRDVGQGNKYVENEILIGWEIVQEVKLKILKFVLNVMRYY